MKQTVLTGGTGFVGANLARRLLREGHTVHLFVRPEHSHWRLQEISKEIQLHLVDLSDFEAILKKLASIKPEWIFHLAAHGAYSWQKEVQNIFQTNLIATVNLLEAALQVGFEAFIHTGTSSEYGFKEIAPLETEWLEPNSHYACAKASATQYCRYSAQVHNAHIITLRLYSTFGPYEDPKRLMPNLIRHGLRGELPPLVDPSIARDYIYVEDVCEACIIAATTPSKSFGAVFNLGTGVQTTLYEVVEMARKVMPILIEPKWGSMPSRSWDTSVWVANNHKIQQELSWSARYNFEQGFRLMVEWQKNQKT